MDFVVLQHWLLSFGGSITDIRVIAVPFTEWLANHQISHEIVEGLGAAFKDISK